MIVMRKMVCSGATVTYVVFLKLVEVVHDVADCHVEVIQDHLRLVPITVITSVEYGWLMIDDDDDASE